MVQEFNLMDLLDKMGAVTLREGRCQWIDIREGVAAVILAGEKVGGRNIEDKVLHERVLFVLNELSLLSPCISLFFRIEKFATDGAESHNDSLPEESESRLIHTTLFGCCIFEFL